MKKNLVLAFIAVLLLTGCAGTPAEKSSPEPKPEAEVQDILDDSEKGQEKNELNTNFIKFENAPEAAVALMINLPTADQKLLLNIPETLNLQETDEKIIIIPRYEHSVIKIYSIDLIGEKETSKEVYSNLDCDKDFAMELQALRPEGMPYYKIEIQSPYGVAKEYYIAYDGKNGNPNIEYILK